jgi:tetratricopeptide (TPR) repeat protein
MKYIQLFEILDKQVKLDEKPILKKFPKAQLSNLKRHLYSQILISLRLIHKKRNITIEIRELMDFAEILYQKGLFLQAMKLLEKAKVIAEKNEDDLSYLNVLEFEKLIESRHITRTGPAKTRIKLNKSTEKLKSISNSVVLSNLKIFLHGLYIKNGHIKSNEEKADVIKIFEENIERIPLSDLNIIEEVYLYQSFVWYYYILIDFVNCYTYALKWVNLIKSSKDIIERDPTLLLRGYHYLLTSAYNTLDVKNYKIYHDELERFRKNNYKKFDTNTQIVSFLYAHHGRYNRVFLSGNFAEGLAHVPRTMRRINRYQDRLDTHKIMVFYFKFAWLYLGAGQPNKALKYLNLIMTMEVGVLRSDIQGYTRLMHIMAHYDMENFDLLDYLTRNTVTFFNKMEEANLLQKKTITFFRGLGKIPLHERAATLKNFEKELEDLELNRYESRAFLYLDILSWLRSKIYKKTLSQIIKEKMENQLNHHH